MTDRVRIDNDMWEDHGKIYNVVSYKRRPDSTAVELVLQLEDGSTVNRTVAMHQIDWIDDARQG